MTDIARDLKIRGPRFEVQRGSSRYPKALLRLAHPPEVLFGIGSVEALREGVAVIGARKATSYGIGCASRFARLAARRGLVVVSGGARGCDAAAHRAALEEGAPTIVFFGGGCDEVYPKEHLPLFQDVVDQGGVVVSEQPWDCPPLPYMFRERNRLIAAMGRCVLVVEAGLPSGTFSTADEALAIGRDVLAVPGAITAKTSAGANRLISQGAVPIVDDEGFEDVLDALFGAPPTRPAAGEAAGLFPAGNPVAAALSAGPRTLEELRDLAASCCGAIDPSTWLLQAVAQGELEGWCVRQPDGRFGLRG
ncbi:DNA-processing protein DprA [Xiamenia xianingshaonis]|uniref:DNA-protecting protein DprA n=1 Tax=Xiamenia xianingshaonis TaxID=2682776 RepID=A0A9E6SV01_9ACTN|nr:DNA-processing protein DprA [Xiamenia xianingshaonis]NHM13674.1 DNA-protecting protein DprA [Xiamenia xianingshaonis]QTU85045.1 DNA-protecting protein DprA [Xiamenia xianingshaonis]